jgi:hypothetical protein
MLERQLRRGKGTRHENVRTARRGNGLLLFAAVLNGLAVLFGVIGQSGALQTVWVVLGLLWLVFTYLLLRQRLYLKRLATEG